MICQVLTALHAIAAPLCVRPGTRAKPENIFIPGGARHARWGSFPKTMVGATFAKGLFASLRLTSGQLTCPKRRIIGKVPVHFQPTEAPCKPTNRRAPATADG